jgi:outer membrane murein-binding lipoprotein Lpp
MKIFEYLTPDNQIALWIIYVLWGLFGLWFLSLLWTLWQHLSFRSQIKRCEDVTEISGNDTTVNSHSTTSAFALRNANEEQFRAFQRARKLVEDTPITRHLKTIFDAGHHESQLDTRSLIKNTSDELLRSNGLQRSLLSIFIILGLLGTLFGLADTLASLDSLLAGSARLNNDLLGQSLQRLLGTLKSAFAPSIWGVSLTVVGVLFLALYFRVVALPLVGLLGRLTLTVWVPQLMPTTSQRLLTKLQVTERQMQRSFEAAQQVAEFAEGIQEKTSDFGQTLSAATTKLNQMVKVSHDLDTFSANFIEGVKVLAPFQQDLRNLYQQVAEESKTFHDSVQSSIVESKAFRADVHVQLNSQNGQLTEMLGGLRSYEAAYVTNRERIDEKLGVVLVEAQRAFDSLSRRNEEIAASLDEGLGKPLRENLAQSLTAIQIELQTRLAEITDSLHLQLGILNERIGRLDEPLHKTARDVGDTFSNFNETTRGFVEKLQREFSQQNDTNQKQLQRLESLSENLPPLLQALTQSSKDFSGTSSSFATQGQQLSTDVATLSQKIAVLTESVDSLKDQVSLKKIAGQLDSTEQRIAELVRQQTNVLQQLGRSIEMMTTSAVRRHEPTFPPDGMSRQTKVAVREPSWRARIKSFFTGGR